MRFIAPVLFCASLSAAQAQVKHRTFKTDSGTVVLHYFSSGQVSTREWTDSDDRWGRSWAYMRDGSVIVEHQTRRIAGHASVHFQYHPNGAVSKAEYRDAPDAGIQWYRSTTTFDDHGNRTGFTEQGHDDHTIIPSPGVRITRTPHVKPPEQEVVVEQQMFVNELFVVNPTQSACRVIAVAKHPSPGLPGGTSTLAPDDTVRLGMYSMGESWPDWKTQVELAINEVVRGDRYHALARIRTDEVKVSPEHRRLYVVIEGWISPKAAPGQEHLPGLDRPDTKKKKRRWLFFR